MDKRRNVKMMCKGLSDKSRLRIEGDRVNFLLDER